MSASYSVSKMESPGTSEEADTSSALGDCLQFEPIEVRMKIEGEEQPDRMKIEEGQPGEAVHTNRNTDTNTNLNTSTNDLPTIAMADGRVITEPSELQILHALDQKINRLERMTVGIFEIIRHLGVQVHGVSNHLGNLDNKIERLVQEASTNNNTSAAGNFSVGQDYVQGTSGGGSGGGGSGSGGGVLYDQNQTSTNTFSGMHHVHHHHHNPSIPMSDISTIPTDSSTRRLSWNERFEELKRYKETNGHCDVPQIYDTGLGTWVSAQRSQFKRYIVGKTSSMTHQRKAALDKLSFSWSLRKRFSWEERFSELKEFSETHNGSCDVPNEGDYKPLWTWCQNQKQAYKRGREGKSHPVPAERIVLMEQIGFRWSTADYATTSYLPLSTPTEGSGSPMSDNDSICSEIEIGEL